MSQPGHLVKSKKKKKGKKELSSRYSVSALIAGNEREHFSYQTSLRKQRSWLAGVGWQVCEQPASLHRLKSSSGLIVVWRGETLGA